MRRLKLDSLKAKISSKRLPENDEKFYLAKSTTFAGVQIVFSVFSEVAGATGVVGLQQCVKSLYIILDAVQVRLL
jgi:hypothetical protein